MAEYRRGAPTVFEIHLHLVRITKHRRPALKMRNGNDLCRREMLHRLISLPPQATIGNVTDDVIAKYIAEQNTLIRTKTSK